MYRNRIMYPGAYTLVFQPVSKLIALRCSNNIEMVDMIYSVEESRTSVVGGPSAGAAITIATISVLEQTPIKDNIMITGTIQKDGTIGPVSSIYEKAVAAKENGATLFLVPKNSSIDILTNVIQKCEADNGIEYCETKYVEEQRDIGTEIGIEIIEVSTIQEAMEYMLE